MKKYLIVFDLAILIFLSSSFGQQHSLTVGYLMLTENFEAEDWPIIRWMGQEKDIVLKPITLPLEMDTLRKLDVLWVHIPDSTNLVQWKNSTVLFQQLKDFYLEGGKLLFTDFAAFFPFWMGIESQKPTIRNLNIKNDWNFDKQGFHSFRGHPIFKGMFGGAYVLDLDEDYRLPVIGYFEEDFPEEGRVVAVRRSFITLHKKEKLITEYNQGEGRILSIGGMIYFSRRNRQFIHLRKLISNSLLYLNGNFDQEQRTYWMKSDLIARRFTPESKSPRITDQRLLNNLPSSELLLKREIATENFFDLAGRRVLIMGKEKGGLDEVWVHPIRILRDLQVGVIRNDSLRWLSEIPARIEVRPESFTRFYDMGNGILQEIIFPSQERGAGVLHFRWQGDQSIRLIVRTRSDLRWMWPYDYDALGEIYYGFDSATGSFHVRDSSGDFYAIMGADVSPLRQLIGQYQDIRLQDGILMGDTTNLNQVYLTAVYPLDEQNNFTLNFAFVGSNEGEQVAQQDFRQLLEQPCEVYRTVARHYQKLLNEQVTFETPDPEFNRLWKWALVGTDRFLVNTPGLGTALVAGYGTTARGWNGNQKISGRPGYAWYFGRDSEWASLAIDAYGDFKLVRQQLAFLQKYQDITGKIFHEISTSGVVHYDAADATPLYIILAAHYLRASGDMVFIRQSWQNLKKAMDFLYSTDTDEDGLIENTNVGHGWVEGGKLWGAHTTFYLAGLWAKTLQDAAYLAGQLGYLELQKKYEQDAQKVRSMINNNFWNPRTRFFNYGLKADGSYMTEPTVLPTVPMYFRVIDSSKVRHMLETYAGNEFTTDWGVRILSSRSPLFNPRGYHYGSVWPLFTGWTASAEFAYGNPFSGFTHIMNNMLIKNYWALGFVEEVMNGAEYQPSGVSPHQAWSETNIILPAIEGMLGWRPDAPAGVAELSPQFPPQWDSVTVKNLRIGDARITFRQQRNNQLLTYRFVKSPGREVKLKFIPQLFPAMKIQKVLLNNQKIDTDVSFPLKFTLQDSAILRILFKGGIAVLPEVPRPKPGDSSSGYRIIRVELKGDQYIVKVAGKSGSRHSFRLRLFNQEIAEVRNGVLGSVSGKGVADLSVSFPISSQEFTEKTVIIRLKD